MSVIIKSGNSTNLANVDSDGALRVSVGLTSSEASGFVTIAAESDPGEVTGFRTLRELETTDDYRLRVGNDQTFFNEYFPGTTLNGAIWNTSVSTMTITQASNFVNLNAALSNASGAFAILRTWRHMPAFMSFPVYCEIDLQLSIDPQNNNTIEWGFGLVATTAAPTDGAFFRLTSNTFRCVISAAGQESQSDDLYSFFPTYGTTNDYLIVLSEKQVEFWINDVLVSVLSRLATAGATTASMNLPVFIRNQNTGVTTSPQVVRVAYVSVSQGDMNTTKPWSHVMAGAGGMAYQLQTGAASFGSTALLTNNLAAGAGAAMTNTTAALGSGLGGQFATQPTLTAGTDGIVSSFQVPAGTAAVPGKSLYITGVKIHGAVTTILTGGPVLYAYTLAFGHTAVSLATSEVNTTAKAPRRIALGFETFAATAAVGTMGSQGGCYMAFNSPILVQPGEFVAVTAKNLGTVTSGGVITFLVSIDGYFE
jgi:hypothetical protein